MRTLFLHIGPHKTGTTFIQQSLASNYSSLLDRGILYPRTGRAERLGHHDLAGWLLGDQFTAERKSKLLEEVAAYDGDVVLSSEDFEYIGNNAIDSLLHIFGSFDIKVIYLVRGWTSLLHSMWQEHVKHGSHLTHSEFCSLHLSNSSQSILLNKQIVLNRFLSAHGGCNFLVAKYEDLSIQGLFPSFMKLIDCEVDGLELDASPLNVSLDPARTEAIRALNDLAQTRGVRLNQLAFHCFSNTPRDAQFWQLFGCLSRIMQRHKRVVDNVDCAIQEADARFFPFRTDAIIYPTTRHFSRLESSAGARIVVDADYLFEAGAIHALESMAEIVFRM